jgi:hypothetical protein
MRLTTFLATVGVLCVQLLVLFGGLHIWWCRRRTERNSKK